MVETSVSKSPELPNLITLLVQKLEPSRLAGVLLAWENLIFSVIIIAAIVIAAFLAGRKTTMVPGRLQGFFEMFVGDVDDSYAA